MKYLKRINESVDTKPYIFKGKTIDITDCKSMPQNAKQIVMKKAGGQNTWVKWYPCDGYFKPLSEVKDTSKIVYFEEADRDNPNAYVYEIGDEEVTDWLLNEGFTPDDEILFIVWW